MRSRPLLTAGPVSVSAACSATVEAVKGAPVDLRPALPGIHQPILLVCGDADPLVNKRCEMELLTGLPNVARVELPQCGHQALYTHPELLPPRLRPRPEQLTDASPSCRQLRDIDGILEIENERIGGRGKSLRLLALAVPGDEQERSHVCGRFIMSAARRQEATSSSRWL